MLHFTVDRPASVNGDKLVRALQAEPWIAHAQMESVAVLASR
jgi:hypothetical protein